VGGWEVEIEGENAEESPYVVMTMKLMESFPGKGGTFQIEPDASSGSYFLAAEGLAPDRKIAPEPFSSGPWAGKLAGILAETIQLSNIGVRGWPTSGWQIDEQFRDYKTFGSLLHDALARKAAGKLLDKNDQLPRNCGISRMSDLGDSIMTAIVITAIVPPPFSDNAVKFTDLGRLRVQECERVVALRTELTKCGAKVVEEGDTLTVYPAKPEELHGAEIETYNDHRMAMCFAILGLKVPGIKIKNPACVKKTFPNFFQKLAVAPPQGLGAEIWEIRDGRRVLKLEGADLFAD
jgi:3-phosphoshikimate 1-carboxyvinyltransferase